jgi:hypothetical protein
LAKCSLALVAVLVAAEAVGVAAWVLALVVELTCAWRPQGRTASFQKVCVAEFISRKLLAARPNRGSFAWTGGEHRTLSQRGPSVLYDPMTVKTIFSIVVVLCEPLDGMRR